MINIAHRGALKEAPENSIEAFQLALECGATRLELDVHPNYDGIPYVIHDETLNRTTNKDGAIRECTVSELDQARLSNHEKVPTLQQVVDRFAKQMEINVEIKGTEQDFIKQIVAICAPYRQHIIISSEFIDTLTQVARLDPDLPIACLLPCRQNEDTQEELQIEEAMRLTGAKIAHPEAKLVTEDMMRTAQHNKWLVYTWISQDDERSSPEQIWSQLKQLKVDGHCTNDPRQFALWSRNGKSS